MWRVPVLARAWNAGGVCGGNGVSAGVGGDAMSATREAWIKGPGAVSWRWTVGKFRDGLRSSVTEWSEEHGCMTWNVFGAWGVTLGEVRPARATQAAIDRLRDDTREGCRIACSERGNALACACGCSVVGAKTAEGEVHEVHGADQCEATDADGNVRAVCERGAK